MTKVPDSMTDRQAWLKWRYDHVGGTDAAVILGKSPFKTPRQLYYEKRNRLDLRPKNAKQLEYYLRLEEIVAERYAAKYNRTLRRQPARVHPELPFIACTVDRQITKHERGPGVLEIKTAGPQYFAKLKLKGAPESYLIQTLHNCEVWGHSWGSLVIMNRDNGDLMKFDFDADPDLWRSWLPKFRDFWQRVEGAEDNPPDDKAKPVKVPDVAPGEMVVVEDDPKLAQAIKVYQQAAAIEREAKETKALASGDLLDCLDDHSARVVQHGGRRIYKISNPGRQSFQRALFEAAHPEIDLNEFYKTGKPSVFSRVYDLEEGNA